MYRAPHDLSSCRQFHSATCLYVPPSCSLVFRHHRHLHSFPPRRSSDLPRPPLPCAAEKARARLLLRLPGRPGGRDRKSTRLNSSHVSISYAVFCLKKKKKRYNGIQIKHIHL